VYRKSNAIRIAIFANATIALAVIRGSKLIVRSKNRFAYLLLSISIPILEDDSNVYRVKEFQDPLHFHFILDLISLKASMFASR
jgi:hypothetical protein